MFAAVDMIATMYRYRRILAATTRVELKKRFAGAVLGMFWTLLNPLIFLLIYLFLMVVTLRWRCPGFRAWE